MPDSLKLVSHWLTTQLPPPEYRLLAAGSADIDTLDERAEPQNECPAPHWTEHSLNPPSLAPSYSTGPGQNLCTPLTLHIWDSTWDPNTEILVFHNSSHSCLVLKIWGWPQVNNCWVQFLVGVLVHFNLFPIITEISFENKTSTCCVHHSAT